MSVRPRFFEGFADLSVRCLACRHKCRIAEGKAGLCGVRKNVDGRLELAVYGRPVDVASDPIEKKPLYHFLPGSQVLSVGTYGCNLSCDFCQNWRISQASKSQHIDSLLHSGYLPPEKVVDYAYKNNIPSIAYTYNEPTVFIEYAYDIGLLAKQKKIRNVLVSNGYFSQQVFETLRDFVDAANIDLKSFNPTFYEQRCGAQLQPTLDNLRNLADSDIWLEVTTLIITGENDRPKELRQIAKFLVSLSPDIPWHVTRFSPAYKMGHVPTTSFAKIKEAAEIGKKAGLKFVYAGNMGYGERSVTVCPECKREVLVRNLFSVSKRHIDKEGKCGFCGDRLPGVWG